MKVDTTRPAYGTQGTYGVEHSTPRPGGQVSTGTPSADSLSFSGDVELAKQAMAAASASPAIRPDAVARGRELIRNGVDVEALSDAMITRALGAWRTE
jgi:hypothetical protein